MSHVTRDSKKTIPTLNVWTDGPHLQKNITHPSLLPSRELLSSKSLRAQTSEQSKGDIVVSHTTFHIWYSFVCSCVCILCFSDWRKVKIQESRMKQLSTAHHRHRHRHHRKGTFNSIIMTLWFCLGLCTGNVGCHAIGTSIGGGRYLCHHHQSPLLLVTTTTTAFAMSMIRPIIQRRQQPQWQRMQLRQDKQSNIFLGWRSNSLQKAKSHVLSSTSSSSSISTQLFSTTSSSSSDTAATATTATTQDDTKKVDISIEGPSLLSSNAEEENDHQMTMKKEPPAKFVPEPFEVSFFVLFCFVFDVFRFFVYCLFFFPLKLFCLLFFIALELFFILKTKIFVHPNYKYHQEIIIRIDSLTNMGWGIGRVNLDEFKKEEITSDDATTSSSSPTTTTASKNDEKLQQEEDDNEVTTEEDRLWVIMVPHVIVDELVKVRVFRNQKKFSEADLIEIIESSPERVQPKCSLAGVCGGCQYQHMSIDMQRQWKYKHIQEVLLQQQIIGYTSIDDLQVRPTLGTDEIYNYRSKITPHYNAPEVIIEENNVETNANHIGTTGSNDGELEDGEDIQASSSISYKLGDIGFQRSSNRCLVDVPICPIATTAINDKYQVVREELHQQAIEGLLNNSSNKKKAKKRNKKRGGRSNRDTGATLLFRHADDDEETGEAVVITDHNQYMTTTVRGLKFRYLAGNFFQNNNYVLPLMVDAVIDAAMAPIAIPSSTSSVISRPKYLIDCYCGSGMFALSVAAAAASSATTSPSNGNDKHRFDACVGIELNEKAVQEATANAKLNGITNCHFMAASAEAIFTATRNIAASDDETTTTTKTKTTTTTLSVQDFPRDETVVVLDPPRKGCSEEFLKQLYEYSPQRIIYMSCGPATQARDAKGIIEIGQYDITSIQPFDLFPQTKHVENLIVFEKRKI